MSEDCHVSACETSPEIPDLGQDDDCEFDDDREFDMSTIRCREDYVLIEELSDDQQVINLIIRPDSEERRLVRGRIHAVGPGRTLDSGERAGMDLRPGDTVIFNRFAVLPITLGGEDLAMMRAGDIYAVVELMK